MRIGIMQPYLFPYIGYFQLINAVDKFVIYDDINYIKGGWINRNYILLNNQKYLFTISLEHSSPNKLINEIQIKDNFEKFRKTILISYAKAPFLNPTIDIINQVLSVKNRTLSDFIAKSIILLSEYLGIHTSFVLSSAIEKDISLKNQNKVIHICKLLQASEYINAIGGQELYNKTDFLTNRLELKFIKTPLISYKQFNNSFIPWLSIIDIMMFNSQRDIKLLLDNYELI
jgi:hypothetical protein